MPAGQRWDARGRAALAALGLAAGLACQGQPAAARREVQEPSPRAVRTADARPGGAAPSTVPAVVQARRRATLASRLSAAVLDLPHAEGERVAAGAVLVRLDDGALRAALAAAEAGAVAADADRARAELLIQRQAATPRELDEARARAAAAAAGVQAARDGLSYAVLRAPFPGVVAARPVHVGDVVSPGTALLELEGEGGLEVVATLDGAQSTLVLRGQSLEAKVDGLAVPVTAVVRALSPAGDQATHRFELRADLPGSAGLRSGLFARLILPRAAGEERIMVPQEALFERGGLTGVYVVADGRAWLRWVAAGARDAGLAEIRAGVAAGERVVLDHQGLTDGAPVKEGR